MKTVRIALLLAAAALAASGCSARRPGTSVRGLELPIEKAAVRLASDVREGGYKLVTTEDLRKWIDANRRLTIIDTLPAGDRASMGHVVGSVNAPMPKAENEVSPSARARLLEAAGPDKDAAIVLYCGFVACPRSHVGAKLLVEAGYRDVNRHPAGIVGWKEAGYPIEK